MLAWLSGARAGGRRGRGAGGHGVALLLAGLLVWTISCQKEGAGSGQAEAQPSVGARGEASAGSAAGARQDQADEQIDRGGPQAAPAPDPGEAPAGSSGGQAPASGAEAGGRVNKPPRARFEVDPLRGYANMTSIKLNSAGSADDIDLSQEMKRRWDFDGDGEWDTGQLRSEFVTWTYREPGRYRPRLLLTDTGGLTDTFTGPEIEILEPCPAPDFALEDINPNSSTRGKIYTLEAFRGAPLVAWFGAPSK
ncbi:MAG: PKD domain-containing protein [Candidatus Eisenbacteria bacterium]|uniref:PKD domain-containing protein n=1 Tax=Eiseniibacteriota bacterium TaxID=2212470 RepID=A0A937X8L6_UNCEI|nr:PKD domain-containing protein [Candidatus Eisenbacteria bacterium]